MAVGYFRYTSHTFGWKTWLWQDTMVCQHSQQAFGQTIMIMTTMMMNMTNMMNMISMIMVTCSTWDGRCFWASPGVYANHSIRWSWRCSRSKLPLFHNFNELNRSHVFLRGKCAFFGDFELHIPFSHISSRSDIPKFEAGDVKNDDIYQPLINVSSISLFDV